MIQTALAKQEITSKVSCLEMSREGSVSQFLESLGLQEFAPGFIKHGFDRVQDLFCLDNQDAALVIPDDRKREIFIRTLRKGTVAK